MKKYFFFLALSGVLFGACAYQSQVVRLNPTLPSSELPMAQSASGEIALRARDVRPKNEIGRRAGGSKGEASITTDQDVVATLKTVMSEILQSKGLRPIDPGPSMARTIDVELRELSYTSFTNEARERKVRILARLGISARNGSQTFEKSFEANQERQVVMEPVAKSNEEWINETLSDAFKQVSTDAKLDAFLASEL